MGKLIDADRLARRIAGHSDYHGDSILSAIYCMAEGQVTDVPIAPIKRKEEKRLCGLKKNHLLDGIDIRINAQSAAEAYT